MKRHPSPIIGKYAFGADSSTYRGIPKTVLDLGFDNYAQATMVPELTTTGIRRVLWWMPGGFTSHDEPDANMSFRTWTLLGATRDQHGRLLTSTMEPALVALEPHIDEVIVYVGNLVSSMPKFTAAGLRAFLSALGDNLSPFAAHHKVSFALDASDMFPPDSVPEHFFQMLRAFGLRVYREGTPLLQCPGQWRDPSVVRDEQLSEGLAGAPWFTPLERLSEEVVVFQPDGDYSTGNASAKLIPWIDGRVAAGFSVAVAPEHLSKQGVRAERWSRGLAPTA